MKKRSNHLIRSSEALIGNKVRVRHIPDDFHGFP